MKLFVWDFHGVLEKGNDNAIVEITNMALEHHGYSRRMTYCEAMRLAGLRWQEYFSFLMPDLIKEQLEELQSTCFYIAQDQPDIIAKYVKLNEHADSVLSSINNSKHQQILISNTLPKFLDYFVELVGIEQCFPAACRFGVDPQHQKRMTKKVCLSEFLNDKKDFESIVSIGDSPADMDLIHSNSSFPGVAYLYTHPDREHRSANCHHKIKDLRSVLEEIEI